MENPEPQAVRDACADLRSEDENKEVGSYLGEPQEADKHKNNARPFIRPDRRHDLRSWMPKPTKEAQKQDDSRKKQFGKPVGPTEVPDVDFGIVDDQAEYSGQRIRVKICGRYIYNYPSEKAMNR